MMKKGQDGKYFSQINSGLGINNNFKSEIDIEKIFSDEDFQGFAAKELLLLQKISIHYFHNNVIINMNLIVSNIY